MTELESGDGEESWKKSWRGEEARRKDVRVMITSTWFVKNGLNRAFLLDSKRNE
jgi:hypothetical protein